MTKITLNELEKDATQELLNISIGRACSSLSTITGKEVYLSTPELLFDIPLEAILHSTPLYSAIIQSFSGKLNGHMALIFPDPVVRRLLSHILQLHVKDKHTPVDVLQDIELDAILEIGNIILNACLGSMTNQLKCSISSELPKYYFGNLKTIKKEASIHQTHSLVLRTQLSITELDISSYLTIVMDSQSLQSYHKLLEAYLSVLKVSV